MPLGHCIRRWQRGHLQTSEHWQKGGCVLMYIPDGYGTVFPYIAVTNPDDFLQFVSAVFGAVELGRTVFPDGRVANVRVKIGSSNFMVSQSVEGVLENTQGAYYIYVEDVDNTFRQAVANNATALFEPDDRPFMDRQAGITDPFGNHWWISTRLVEEPYDVDSAVSV